MNIDIESNKRRLLIKYPFFGSIVANTKFQAEPSIETAATDGETIFYNPTFINSLTQDEQTFIFAHEVCHIAFDHIYRSEGKDQQTWNIATDSVINAFLKQDGLPIIDGGVDIADAINHDSETMYKKLLQENSQQSERQNNQGKGEQINSNQSNSSATKTNQASSSSESSSKKTASDTSPSQPPDEHKETDSKGNNQNRSPNNHGLWNKAIEKRKAQNQDQIKGKDKEEKDKKKTPESILDKLFNRKKDDKKQNSNNSSQENETSEEEQKKQEHIKKISSLGEKKTFKQNKIERSKRLEELRQALAEQSHGYGSGTNSEHREVTDIGVAAPLIDWRKLLKEAVKHDVDWSYQNASIEDGVITPYLEEIPKPETEIILDTSGSINKVLLKNFLRECKNILQTSKVKVGCFDDRFYGFNEIRNVSDIDSMNFVGGGGTNFNAAVNAFSRRVENKIIFTDGSAPMPNKAIDAIWVVFGGRKISPRGGKVIYISEEHLRRLYSYTIEKPERKKSR